MPIAASVEKLMKTQMPDPDALREEIEKGEELEEEEADEKNTKTKEECTFKFDWKSPAGKRYHGEFTNSILTINQRTQAGVLQARLSRGVPYDALDPLTRELNMIVAHLTFSLKKRPDWAKDLTSLQDFRVLQELYLEVASHEATFLG
jgi:hypothetical protein